jgi:hypothetical protein
MLAARPHRQRMIARPRTAPGPGSRLGEVIPYDYGTIFPITGRPGNLVQSVINTAPDSVFVAVAIGYGFEEDRGRVLSFEPEEQNGEDPPPEGTVLPGDITLRELPASALIEGFRVNPRSENLVFRQDDRRGIELSDDAVPAALVRNGALFQRVRAPAEISFLFSILDSGTGRELQDVPAHNIASLGKSNGERPFRLLAQPITFLPRSTIRLQIVERSQGVQGNLFVVFYGYQVIGSSGCPESVARRLTGSPMCPTETIGSPSARVIPFDYVTTFQLTGRPQNQLESEVTVNAEGGFVATSIGYGLLVEESEAPIDLSTFSSTGSFGTFSLVSVKLRSFAASALTDGIRIRPDLLRIAFKDNGQLAEVPNEMANELFERLSRPEDVSFRYTIFDSGRGRELQNQPLHNVAGLGIADGDRPFKKLARSMIFQPRSTIRIRVEERFGRGTLFIVLQGYKFLSAPAGAGLRR